MKMKILSSLIIIIELLCFVACGSSSQTTLREDSISSEEVIVEDSQSGVDQLKNIAMSFNIMNAEEQRASLSEQNPMPNIKQEVDEKDKMFVFYYIWNENVAPMESLNHEAGMRRVMTEMSNNPQSMNFMKILAQEGYGIRFVVNGSKTNKESINEASADEIKEMIELTN